MYVSTKITLNSVAKIAYLSFSVRAIIHKQEACAYVNDETNNCDEVWSYPQWNLFDQPSPEHLKNGLGDRDSLGAVFMVT